MVLLAGCLTLAFRVVRRQCYLHSPRPLSAKEILKVMPTDASISKIYSSMNERAQLQGIIPTWGDAISWGDLHNYDKLSFNDWD